ncbi:CKLF-like MARVEL transmembrane domain-containing protein 8 isoform X1 [Hyperolius riggenbachi]
MEEERPRSQTVTTTTSSYCETFTTSTSLSYDKSFLTTAPGLLLLAEIVFGLLVWALIAGSEYFLFAAFGWVMFVAVFYWVLTVFLLIIYITRAYTRIPKVPWTLVGLCFNGSAFILYLISAVVDATSVSNEIPQNHNYNTWAASAFFAFVVTTCYAASTYFSFRTWRTRS